MRGGNLHSASSQLAWFKNGSDKRWLAAVTLSAILSALFPQWGNQARPTPCKHQISGDKPQTNLPASNLFGS
jgi:hypothetical protein